MLLYFHKASKNGQILLIIWSAFQFRPEDEQKCVQRSCLKGGDFICKIYCCDNQIEQQSLTQAILMSKKHLWSKKQDELLIKLKNQLKLQKWVEIAQTINQHFKGQTLSGKQCRDRFINKLSQHLRERDWEPEEDRALMKLLSTYGRRWSLIAQSLSGRSENSIKNHFYARLRRSIRELDKFIKRYMSSSYSTVDNNFLNKVLQISGHKFSEDTVEEEETIEKANNIIQFLFWQTEYSEPTNIQLQELIIKIQLIQDLGGINKIEETLKKEEQYDYEPYNYISEAPYQIKIEPSPLLLYNPYYFYCPHR